VVQVTERGSGLPCQNPAVRICRTRVAICVRRGFADLTYWSSPGILPAASTVVWIAGQPPDGLASALVTVVLQTPAQDSARQPIGLPRLGSAREGACMANMPGFSSIECGLSLVRHSAASLVPRR
jgi:hypothetical protein